MSGLRWPLVSDPSLRHSDRAAGPLEELLAPDRPEYTLVVPFSRPWAWERWLEHFRGVYLPPGTECIAIIDHDDEAFAARVKAGLQELRLCGLRVLWTRRAPVAEWSEMDDRRARICGHWHTFLAHAEGRILLGAEDDTLPDWDAYNRLLGHVGAGAVFAQGTCIGRWDSGIVPHWTVVEDAHGPLEWHSGSYEGDDLVDIQGGGWYCFAAPTGAIRQVEFQGRATGLPVGPDVLACLQLSRLGRCVGDWRIQCTHFCETADLSPNRHVVDRVSFRFHGGRWRREVTAGQGRVVPGREVQISGSQPRPFFNLGAPIRTVKLFGNAPMEVKEFSRL